MLDNKGRPRETSPTAPKVSGVSEGVAPEGTRQRLCPHSPVLKERRLANDKVERDAGEPDAMRLQS
jgi:hypothetical protein